MYEKLNSTLYVWLFCVPLVMKIKTYFDGINHIPTNTSKGKLTLLFSIHGYGDCPIHFYCT